MSPFTDTYKTICGVPIATAATAWTSKDSAITYMLVMHKGLWMPGEMDHTLINPNQLRHYGTTVQDNPYSGSPLYIMTEDESFILPLETDWVNIIAQTRTPTQRELDECIHVQLNIQHPWNPETFRFPTPERSVEEEVDIVTVGATQASYPTMNEEDDQDVVFSIDRISSRIAGMSVRANVSAIDTGDVSLPPTFTSRKRHSDVTPEDLSKRWGIGFQQALATLKATTQRIVRSAVMPLGRRYKADRLYEKKRLDGKWYTNTMDGHILSYDGNRYGQVFTNKQYFAAIYPMDRKSKAGKALRLFCKEFGVPEQLTLDGSKEQTGKNTGFMRQVRKNDINYHVIEPNRHNQNPAEGVIQEIRRKWLRTMVRKKVPRRFWDYGAKWTCEVMQRTHTRLNQLDSGVPLEAITGETIDISEYLDFGFYDWIWYHENAGLGEKKLGRWLGIPKRIGSTMTYYVLTTNCQVICRTTVQRVTNIERQTEEVKSSMMDFDAEIGKRLRDLNPESTGGRSSPSDWADIINHDKEFIDEYDRIINNKNIQEADEEYTPEILDDTYLNMEVAMPRSDAGTTFARVTKRMKDAEGRPIGVSNQNPILDSRLYEVEYQDGYKSAMAANAIAMNMFSQVDEEGNRHVLFDEIVDYCSNKDALKTEDSFLIT
ncbi:MAG: hypothetical protein ABIO63_02135, partial [Casimicrobiaceae bacterium]